MKKKPFKIDVYFSTKEEKEKAIEKAEKAGFDSVSAYIKFLIKNS